MPAGFGQSISPYRKPAGMDGRRSQATPGIIMLDLSTALGEYSGLENTPLSPPTQIQRVDESGRM
jgi:hypothetical protein